MIKDDGYLREARRIFRLAKRGYAKAKEKKNEMKARQAADKGYLCLLNTVNALFIKCGMDKDKLPKTERGRLHFLGKYADRDFRIKYNSIYKYFHIDAFHEGIIDHKILNDSFESLEELIKQVASDK